MTTVTEADIKELKNLIGAQTKKLNAISVEINELRVSVSKIEATLQVQQPLIQKIPDLAEKVGELKNYLLSSVETVAICSADPRSSAPNY